MEMAQGECRMDNFGECSNLSPGILRLYMKIFHFLSLDFSFYIFCRSP